MTRHRIVSGIAAGAGLAVGAYAALVALGWARYGHASTGTGEEHDEQLERFVPRYDVVERHHIRVAAPASVTFAAAREQDLLDSPLTRAIFRARAIVLRAAPEREPAQRGGLLAQVQALGWGILVERPGREVVVGAVTKPWEANVTFRALPPDQFAAFSEPGFVKIAWTLRADPVSPGDSIFRTETRAVATDAEARRRFRRYWAFVSPGIATIRWLSLRPLKREAERRGSVRPLLQVVQP